MKFKFDLDGNIENLDDAPTEFHSFFAKNKDGTYAVQDAFKASAKVINALGTNLLAEAGKAKSAREEAAATRQRYAGFDDVLGTLEGEDKSPAALRARMDALAAAAKTGDPEAAKAQVESIRRQMADAHGAEKAALTKQLQDAQAEVNDYVVSSQVTAAIAAAKGVPELLLPIVSKATKVVRENGKLQVVIVGEDGTAVVDSAGSPISVSTFVEGLKKHKVLGRAFDSETKPSTTSMAPGNKTVVRPQTEGVELTAAQKISAGLTKRG